MKISNHRNRTAFSEQDQTPSQGLKRQIKNNLLVVIGIMVGMLILLPEGIESPSMSLQLPQVQDVLLPRITFVIRSIIEFNFYQ